MTGQMMLTLAALMLLTTSLLNFNRTMTENGILLAQNRYRLEALSILNSHMEEASQRYFDEASLDTLAGKNGKTLLDFTKAHDLGLEANDYGVIDDFDDYHQLTVLDTGLSGVPYKLYFEVDYVGIVSGKLKTSGNREYSKRIKAFIMDDFSDPLIYTYDGSGKVRDTLSVEYVFSYWFYN
ncbi:MAG TPA: hypothetical protein PLG66_21355 [Calditrichia bacterium]|nr:hypothetical protein [Calditrichia bacterium]